MGNRFSKKSKREKAKKDKKKQRRRRRYSDSESSRESESHNEKQQTVVVADERPAPKPVIKPHEGAYPPVSQDDLDILFYKAHTEHGFLDIDVPSEYLRQAIKLSFLAPTAYNCCPMRVIFVTRENKDARDKLLSCLMEGNKHQTLEAPVTAIICTDDKYTHQLPKLMPYVPNAQQMFEQYEDLNEMIKIRNANLQGGYLMLALRALGLGVGPMSGFDNQAIDEAFLQGTSWRSNFLLNIGYGDPTRRYPRQPRFAFDEAAKLI